MSTIFVQDEEYLMIKNISTIVYPVGSLYWSTSSTSPASTLGGTWSLIEDKYIYARGESSIRAVGTAFGNSTATINSNNIPSLSTTFTPSGSIGVATFSYSTAAVTITATTATGTYTAPTFSDGDFGGTFSGTTKEAEFSLSAEGTHSHAVTCDPVSIQGKLTSILTLNGAGERTFETAGGGFKSPKNQSGGDGKLSYDSAGGGGWYGYKVTFNLSHSHTSNITSNARSHDHVVTATGTYTPSGTVSGSVTGSVTGLKYDPAGHSHTASFNGTVSYTTNPSFTGSASTATLSSNNSSISLTPKRVLLYCWKRIS